MLSEAEVRAMFNRMVRDTGGVRAMAKSLGCTPSYVSDMNNGRRAPSPAVLERLGLIKVVGYIEAKVPAMPAGRGPAAPLPGQKSFLEG